MRTLYLLACAAAVQAQTYTVSTVFGGGPAIGTPASAVSLSNPQAFALDPAGNLYVIQTHQIWVFSGGVLSAKWGTGVAGFSGDGGPASNAQFSNPADIAADSAGNIYVADNNNCRIRKITAGIVTTLAGNGSCVTSGDGGPAASAGIAPGGLGLDPAGNIYVVDQSRVRRIDTSNVITHVAGNGTYGFSGDGGAATAASCRPFDVVADGSGNVYLLDLYRIRKITSGIITTFAGTGTPGSTGDGGAATSAQIGGTSSLGIDAAHNVLLAEWGFHRVRRITPGGIISTAVLVNYPLSATADATGTLFFTSTNFSNTVQKQVAGVNTVVAGNGFRGSSGDGGPGTLAQIPNPIGLFADTAGNVLVGDYTNYRIRLLNSSGTVSTIAGTGAVGASGNGGPALAATFRSPQGVTRDAVGNTYVSDSQSNQVRRIDTNGTITHFAGSPLEIQGSGGDGGPANAAQMNRPAGLRFDAVGNLYIADEGNHRIRRIDPTGTITTVAGNGTAGSGGDGGAATGANLNSPTDVAVDAAGNVFIADFANSRVRKVTPAGIISTLAFVGFVRGLDVDAAGNVVAADPQTDRVVRIAPNGSVTPIAGTGVEGYGGDGGPALSAQFNTPVSISVQPGTGHIFVADQNNHRVRKLTRNPQVTVATNPTGRSIFVDSVAATAPQVYDWLPGSSHTLNVTSPQAGAPGTRYSFASWSQGGAASQTVTPTADVTYTANFTTEHELTVNVSGNGTVSPATGSYHAAGSSVTLTPTAGACSVFQGFSPASPLTMNAPQTVTATFASNAATTAAVTIARGTPRFNRLTNRYQQALTITNPGAAVSGALSFDGLPAGVALVSPNGTTSCAAPAGQPLRTLAIGAGATVSLTVEFTAPNATTAITYTNRMLVNGAY